MPKTYILDVEEMELRRLLATEQFQTLMSAIPIKQPGPHGVVKRGKAAEEDGHLRHIAAELTRIMNITYPVVRITETETNATKKKRRTLLEPSGVSPRRRIAESEKTYLHRKDDRFTVGLPIVSPE